MTDKTDIDADESLKQILLEMEKTLVKSCLDKLKGDPEKLRGTTIKEIRLLLESYKVLKPVNDKESQELEKLEPSFDEETLKLFAEIEATRNYGREDEEQKEKSWDTLPLR